MRVAVVFLALLGLCLAEFEVEDGVMVLTTENFDEATESNRYILVEFYAPWCGHCKALAPDYAKAAKALAEEGSEIKLAKVDATEENSLAQKFGVRGYPTLKFFKNGKEMDYGGGRTADSIVAWLKKKTGPPAEDLTSVEEAKTFVEKADVVIVGFFESAESTEAKAFIAAADSEDTLSFGITTDLEVANSLDATFDSVIVFKKFDEGRATFSGEYTAEAILDFVLTEQLPLITKFSDQTAPKIFGGSVRNHLLAFFSSEEEEQATAILATLKTVAVDYKGQILFVHIDSSEDESGRIMDFFNLEEDEVPTLRLITLEDDMKKYVPPFSEIEADPIRSWLQDFVDGKLSPHLNSEEIPDDWDTKPVKVLVGKNFGDVALDSDKLVFVEFYAPWCGHCKQLAPIWDQLAEHFKEDDDVVIAKMDATKNEVEQVSVQGFPTLKFFGKDNEMMDYNGGRTLDDLIQFVEAQAYGEGEDEEGEDESEGGEDEGPEAELRRDEL